VYAATGGVLKLIDGEAPGLDLRQRPQARSGMEGGPASVTTEALRASAGKPLLERLPAPEARAHGRAAKAQSAQTRAPSRTAVAGSRIMLGSRRWRGAEPDGPRLSPTSRGPRRLYGCRCGRKPELWW
jgi:hypothetical protein